MARPKLYLELSLLLTPLPQHDSPESVLGAEVLDAVAVHEAPVARRAVRVVAHHVQVQRVLHAVHAGHAALCGGWWGRQSLNFIELEQLSWNRGYPLR